ncbi:hypothetical protein GN956_G25329 [Arapaima gigas]
MNNEVRWYVGLAGSVPVRVQFESQLLRWNPSPGCCTYHGFTRCLNRKGAQRLTRGPKTPVTVILCLSTNQQISSALLMWSRCCSDRDHGQRRYWRG